MTSADRLRNRADELERIAWAIRWTEPTESHHTKAVAKELREMASHLPPERTEP